MRPRFPVASMLSMMFNDFHGVKTVDPFQDDVSWDLSKIDIELRVK